jgi:uncharacterized membrane protein
MNLQPLINAPFAVHLHVATVVPAIALGVWLILLSRKGARGHRIIGAAYLALMVVTCGAALFIHSTNPSGPLGFSFIHLFVPLTLFGIVRALLAVRRHDVRAHRSAMLGVFVGGILIAGSFAFTPGRIMYRMFFGG